VSALTLLDDQVTEAGVHELRMFSPAVGREVAATLLTPPGWQPGGANRYPVLYLLHGSSDDHLGWTRHTEIARLAASENVLVVIPEGGRMGFYTDWKVTDRLGTVPGWETFHLVELLSLLESEYGASDVRAVAGISMGGYGALRYGMRRPGMFRAVGSLSGLMHLTRRGMGPLLGLLAVREGMRPGRIWGPRRSAAESWADNDPLLHIEAFAKTKVYLAAGDGHRVPGEQFVAGMGLVERYSRAMTEDFAERLTLAGVDVTTRLTTGTHFWRALSASVDEFWPYAVKALTD
jgi:diacylglycerol O-acyltransferase / trehalose O-mycolyltransferase